MFPFFLALGWKGWLRAGALDEIVGLDLSYHGGNPLSLDSSVKPEFFKAYEERKEKRRSARRGSSASGGAGAVIEECNDSDDEEAVIETTEHADISDSQSSQRRESARSVEAWG